MGMNLYQLALCRYSHSRCTEQVKMPASQRIAADLGSYGESISPMISDEEEIESHRASSPDIIVPSEKMNTLPSSNKAPIPKMVIDPVTPSPDRGCDEESLHSPCPVEMLERTSVKRKHVSEDSISVSHSLTKMARLNADDATRALQGKVSVVRDDASSLAILIDRQKAQKVLVHPPYSYGDLRLNSLDDIFQRLYEIEDHSSDENLQVKFRDILEEKERAYEVNIEREREDGRRRMEKALEELKYDFTSQLRVARTRLDVAEAERKLVEGERDQARETLQSMRVCLRETEVAEQKWREERLTLLTERDQLRERVVRASKTFEPGKWSPASSQHLRSQLAGAIRRAEAAEEHIRRHSDLGTMAMQELSSVSTWLEGYAKHTDQPNLIDAIRELFTITGRLSALVIPPPLPPFSKGESASSSASSHPDAHG